MDTIQQFLQQQHSVQPQGFVIGGASKVMIMFLIEDRVMRFFFCSVDGQVHPCGKTISFSTVDCSVDDGCCRQYSCCRCNSSGDGSTQSSTRNRETIIVLFPLFFICRI